MPKRSPEQRELRKLLSVHKIYPKECLVLTAQCFIWVHKFTMQLFYLKGTSEYLTKLDARFGSYTLFYESKIRIYFLP